MSQPRTNFIYKSSNSSHGNEDGWWFAINEFAEEDVTFFDELLYIGAFETKEEAMACSVLFQNTGFETPIIPENITNDICGVSCPPTSVDLDAAIRNQCIDNANLSYEKLLKRYYEELASIRVEIEKDEKSEQVTVDRKTLEFLLEEFENWESVEGVWAETNEEIKHCQEKYKYHLAAREALKMNVSFRKMKNQTTSAS